jgi:peptidoglycan-associated lipoprotein
MKARNWFNLFVFVLALSCLITTGCRKKPVRTTPLPGSKTGPVGDLPPGAILPGGDGPGTTSLPNGNGPGDRPQSDRSLHAGWNEDRETFKSDTVYFDFDSSTIKSGEKSKIEEVAAYLKAHGSVAVKVEGNCDERGTEEYNRALGERRALAIREYLINSGVAADAVDTVSFGEDKPAETGHSEEAWKKNRRGEFVLLTAPK